ncbi:hypothetical protein ACGFJC_43190 [Nonomuraea fuscirosea]|uniref:hypothetical protein n=1 Tax=Nonomuraea fuscirosea TaxID=1291556 RepID=UPI003721BA2A
MPHELTTSPKPPELPEQTALRRLTALPEAPVSAGVTARAWAAVPAWGRVPAQVTVLPEVAG